MSSVSASPAQLKHQNTGTNPRAIYKPTLLCSLDRVIRYKSKNNNWIYISQKMNNNKLTLHDLQTSGVTLREKIIASRYLPSLLA